ncbi:transposase (plasmid) [Skermanella rosea]|uniref:transposase n=1 Tax=Skermanella rosea TaxID=1817965 RepID=UPI001932F62C|nr:transposase [Skermanella rosea]UEM06977.1 transposase [Skermanella rosea]
MARPTRLILPGQTHHVLQRGNNRQDVFFDDEDRRLFLTWLGEAVAGEGCALHAYVLMGNHFHLVVTAGGEESIPRLMQSVGRRYVAHVNRTRGRTGTLWEGRYKSTILDSEGYVLACHRYVEANPVRAGIVSAPEDFPWSSYGHNALGRRDPLLAGHPTYAALGRNAAERRAAYRELFGTGPTGEEADILRDATQRGWVPGSDAFRRGIERALGRRVDPPRRGRPPNGSPKPSREAAPVEDELMWDWDLD